MQGPIYACLVQQHPQQVPTALRRHAGGAGPCGAVLPVHRDRVHAAQADNSAAHISALGGPVCGPKGVTGNCPFEISPTPDSLGRRPFKKHLMLQLYLKDRNTCSPSTLLIHCTPVNCNHGEIHCYLLLYWWGKNSQVAKYDDGALCMLQS